LSTIFPFVFFNKTKKKKTIMRIRIVEDIEGCFGFSDVINIRVAEAF
jgi:hypothetical protein